jgi:hypothetical protein
MKAPQKAKKSSQPFKAKSLTRVDFFEATYRASREEGVPNFPTNHRSVLQIEN